MEMRTYTLIYRKIEFSNLEISEIKTDVEREFPNRKRNSETTERGQSSRKKK